PIIDTSLAITFPPGDVRIIGFLQGFIESVSNGGPLSISVRILNIAGCGNNPGTTSVQAGGTSAIPVRLISQEKIEWLLLRLRHRFGLRLSLGRTQHLLPRGGL